MPPFRLSQFENGLYLVFAVAIGVLGFVLLCAAVYVLWRAPVRQASLREVRRIWRLDAAVDDATLHAALRVKSRISAWSGIFAGVGVMLVSVAWLSIAWFSAGNFLLVGVFGGWGPVISVAVAIGALGSAGYAYGIHRMRARARNHPTHGDLRPRRVRDFVPMWVGMCFAIWLLVLVILTMVAWIFAKVPLRTQLGLDPDRWVYLPLGRWCVLVGPLLATLCVVLGLGLLHWIVALPRLKSLDELPDVGVFDVHFRRESIFFVLHEDVILILPFFAIQWSLVLDNVPAQSLPTPIDFILLAAGIANLLIFLGMVIGLTVTRLGSGVAGPPRRDNVPAAL